MSHGDALREVFGQPKYRLAAAAIAAAAAPVLAITSNILAPDGLALNPFAEPARVALMAAIAAAMAVNGAVLLHNHDMRKSAGGRTTAIGALAALFTSACPVCQPVWLVWLGLGTGTAFLSGVGLYAGAFSLAMLLVSIHYSLKSAESFCEVV